MKPHRILFICLGNICRSCAAQTVMQKLVNDADRSAEFELDSAGLISYHHGEHADPRMRMHAKRRGYDITHLSRPITQSDFLYFDLILGMDDSNMDRLMELAPTLDSQKKIQRMTDYCQEIETDHIPDPYYGGSSGFEYVLDVLEDACQGLLDSYK